MAWVLFSVGAENLAKAACVCNGVVQVKIVNQNYPMYTDSISTTEWACKVIGNNWSNGDPAKAAQYNYGTLEKYWKEYLPKLCERQEICCKEKRHLIASYKYLTQVIRNKDAHTYIADKRGKDFPAVKSIF
ncbi:MAG: hypothetical protein J4F46_03830 [Dehalococcoidia bacterium]|nr:hypothetical protein [Dehalococcoidia bacterium]